jgi:hypothetical protein
MLSESNWRARTMRHRWFIHKWFNGDYVGFYGPCPYEIADRKSAAWGRIHGSRGWTYEITDSRTQPRREFVHVGAGI